MFKKAKTRSAKKCARWWYFSPPKKVTRKKNPKSPAPAGEPKPKRVRKPRAKKGECENITSLLQPRQRIQKPKETPTETIGRQEHPVPQSEPTPTVAEQHPHRQPIDPSYGSSKDVLTENSPQKRARKLAFNVSSSDSTPWPSTRSNISCRTRTSLTTCINLISQPQA